MATKLDPSNPKIQISGRIWKNLEHTLVGAENVPILKNI
jgi:hypothetical protein